MDKVVETIEKNDKLQRKLALKAFLEGAGFKEFEYEFGNLNLGADAQIASLTSEKVTSDKLQDLNFNLGVKAGLQRVLWVLEGFKEELETKD